MSARPSYAKAVEELRYLRKQPDLQMSSAIAVVALLYGKSFADVERDIA